MPTTREQGQLTEKIAAQYLIEHGLSLIASNCLYKVGELDLVMLDSTGKNSQLVFVEVRYRKSNAFGGALYSVNFAKQQKLRKAAQCFLLQHPHYAQLSCRFDLIALQGLLVKPRLSWLKNIID